MNYLAKNIIYLKKGKAVTNASIALQVNKSHNTISNWINEISQPGIEELQILAHFLGVTVDELINVDLSNVHLNQNAQVENNKLNVHLNVHPSVHLNAKKQQKQHRENPVFSDENMVNEDPPMYQTSQTIEQAQTKTIQALEQLNALLAQQVAVLTDQVTNLKREIPTMAKPMEAQASKSA